MLVDENDDFLDGLSRWLDRRPDVEVVGVAHSAVEAAERAERLRPDLLLMDMSLPDMGGLEALRLVKTIERPPLVYLMSFHDDLAFRSEARAEGADGCFSKPRITRELPAALRTLTRVRAAAAPSAGGARAPAPRLHGRPPEARRRFSE